MNIDIILNELRQYRGYFPREAVEEAIRQRDAITPHLLSAIEEAAEQRHVPEEGLPFLPLYAMFLLAQFRDRRAYPLIIKLCRLPEHVLDDLLGDTLTESLNRIIASVYDGNLVHLKSLIEDSAVNEYVRGSALRALGTLVHEGELSRADLIAYIGELFHGKLEQEPGHAWDEAAAIAVDLNAKELADDIKTGYEQGLLDPTYMHPDEVDEMLEMQGDPDESQLKRECEGFITDVVDEMCWWHCFEPDRGHTPMPSPFRQSPSSSAFPDTPTPYARSEPKIGRNALCPCGSGKKYKKCCGQ